MATYYIMVRGTCVAVAEEVSKAYRKINRHYRYLKHKDAANGLVYISSLNTCEFSGIEMLADPNADVAETVVTKMMCQRIRECLLSLSEDECNLITMLFYEEISEVALARAMGIPRTTLQSRKYMILDKLRKLLENT